MSKEAFQKVQSLYQKLCIVKTEEAGLKQTLVGVVGDWALYEENEYFKFELKDRVKNVSYIINSNILISIEEVAGEQ